MRMSLHMGNLILSRSNLYSFFIWLIIAMLAGGSTVGGNLQPSRLLTIFAGLLIITHGKLFNFRTLTYKALIAMVMLWTVWGVASLMWTPDFFMGRDEMLLLLLGFITIFTFIHLSWYASEAFTTVRAGWVTACILTIPLAVYELTTNQHLPNAIEQGDTGGVDSMTLFYAATTFGNRNNYSSFLVMCFPFLLWSFEKTKKLMFKLFYLCILAYSVFVIFVNGSRLGMISLALQSLTWLLMQRTSFKSSIRRFIFVLLACAVILFAFQFQNISFRKLQSLDEGLQGRNQIIRTNLSLNGLMLFLQSKGLGVGAGGFEKSVLTEPGMFPTYNVGPAHNLWIEILANYGLFVWGGFVAWLIAIYWSVSKIRKFAKKSKLMELELAMRHTMILIMSFPFCFMMHSSILRWTMLWTVLATIAIMAELGRKQRTYSVIKGIYTV